MASITFPLERADDGLSLQVELIDLDIEPTLSGWQVVRNAAGQGAIAVTFPPQHTVEYADGNSTAPEQPAPIFAAETRVVFLVPAGTAPIPLSVDGLLAGLTRLELLGGPGSIPDVPEPDPLDVAGIVDGDVRSTRLAGVGTGAARRRLAEARALGDRRALAAAEAAAADSDGTNGDTTDGTNGTNGDDSTGGTTAAAAEPAADATLAGVSPTSVMAPSRLELAIPSGAARFTHASRPAQHGANVEQWHTRLATRTVSETSPPVATTSPVTVRTAVESQVVPSTGGTPAQVSYRDTVVESKIKSALTPTVAKQLRTQTAISPIDLRELALSPAGATVDLEQSWDTAEGTWPASAGDPALKSYRHRVAWGRDGEIRTVQRGRVLPFGLQAILTTTTKRVPRSDSDGAIAALRTRSVLTLYQTTRTFTDLGPNGRAWPWEAIRVLNRVSPPGSFPAGANAGHLELGTSTASVPFELQYRARDRGGNEAEFTLPAFFALSGVAGFDETAQRNAWKAMPGSFHTASLGGRPVQVVPPGSSTEAPGGADTATIMTETVALNLVSTGGYKPSVTYFEGSSPVVNGIAGSFTTRFSYRLGYIAKGFDAVENPGELILDLAERPVLDLAGDAQALARVGLAPIFALSRKVGAVAAGGAGAEITQNLAEVAQGRFHPETWLGNLPADLFGVFPLEDLLALRDEVETLAKAPSQVAEVVNGRKTLSSTWDTVLLERDQSFAPVGSLATLTTTPGADLSMRVESHAEFDPPTQTVRARATSTIRDARLRLVKVGDGPDDFLVTLPVRRIVFESTDNAAPTVDVDLGGVAFGGPLAYVKALADLIGSSGLAQRRPADTQAAAGAATEAAAVAGGPASGPSIDVTDTSVKAGMALAIPDLAIGVFALRDMAFTSSFEVFFDGGPPRLALDFATIDNPFRLSVSAITGGGHMGIAVTSNGIERITGALEFGASVSVDLAGIARGSASVMGGVYFELAQATGLTLTGYLDIRGKLEILSIVSLSVAVTLSLTYVEATGKVEGTAELVVKVKVLFFKKTVRFEVHRQFAGSNADPTFAEVMNPAELPPGAPRPWDAYCTAFAAA